MDVERKDGALPRREVILRAAQDLIAAHGPAVSTRRIGQAASQSLICGVHGLTAGVCAGALPEGTDLAALVRAHLTMLVRGVTADWPAPRRRVQID